MESNKTKAGFLSRWIFLQVWARTKLTNGRDCCYTRLCAESTTQSGRFRCFSSTQMTMTVTKWLEHLSLAKWTTHSSSASSKSLLLKLLLVSGCATTEKKERFKISPLTQTRRQRSNSTARGTMVNGQSRYSRKEKDWLVSMVTVIPRKHKSLQDSVSLSGLQIKTRPNETKSSLHSMTKIEST